VSTRSHRISARLFDALAQGGGGEEAVRELAAAQYSKHVILLRGVIRGAKAAGADQARLASQGYDLLASVQELAPAAADAVISYPSVGAWALQAIRDLSGPPDSDDDASGPPAMPAGLGSIAAAAAIRAGLTAEIEVPVVNGLVVLPSQGVACVNAERAVVHSAASGARIVWPGGRIELSSKERPDSVGWLPLRSIRADSLELLIDDVDPFRMPAAPYPGPRLTSTEASAWNQTFQQAWQLLTQHHALIAEEFAAATSVIVPLLAPPTGRVSSSSPETFGAIAMSGLSDPCTLAVTLAHELQHLKLSALIDVVPLTLPDDGRRFYAPWRSDPRPASGLLQGAYAFLGVSGFWERQRHMESGDAAVRANAEFARWRSAALQVVATLQASGQLTPAGLDFAQVMARTLGAWENDLVPEEAQALARREAERHLAAWQSANGPTCV
jgi:HEXXH motif-containing protein